MEVIQSKQNASIKTARKLLQRKHRKTSYLIEGWHLFEEAKASGAHILQIFVLEEMADRVANMSKVKLVSPEVLKELCETQTPQGIVAEVAKQTQALPDSLSGKYLLLEDVQDPGNVGTMIRTADAADYDGVFLSDTNPTLSEYYNLNRAIYWMEFAVNNGNIDAKSKLQELKKLKRMDRRKNKENP